MSQKAVQLEPVVPVDPDVLHRSLRGAFGSVTPDGGLRIRRLPSWTAAQTGGDVLVEVASRHTSGVRLEFTTSASTLKVECVFTRTVDQGQEPKPAVIAVTAGDREIVARVAEGTDVMILRRPDREYDLVHADPVTLTIELGTSRAPRLVTVWLPPGSGTEVRGVWADAPISPATRRSARWVHHGSSISECLDADDPLGVWPVIVARHRGLDLTNLGLVGSAMLDQFTARTIRDLPAELISVKVGINIVNEATHTRRSMIPAVHGFLDTIRDGHPKTPLLLVSPIYCAAHEEAPGPTMWIDGRAASGASRAADGDNHLTLASIRTILRDVVSERAVADPHLYYLDGLQLLGEADARRLPDGLHPDAEGYRLMARRFLDEMASFREMSLEEVPS